MNTLSAFAPQGAYRSQLEYICCDICGTKGQSLLVMNYRRDKIIGIARNWAIVKCRQCGLIFVNPRLQPDRAAQRYGEIYFSHYEDEPQAQHDGCTKRFSVVKKYFPPGFTGRILDVGCGLGYFVEYLNRNGWDAHGIEVSRYAEKVARNRGLTIVAKDFLTAEYPARYFDGIVMWDVLEHVPYPMKYLQHAYRILKPGGILFIQTPNVENISFLVNEKMYPWHPTEHLFYFSRKTITLLIEKSNFRLIDLTTAGNMNWMLTRLCEKEEHRDIHRNEQRALEQKSAPRIVCSVSHRCISIINKLTAFMNCGEILRCIAQKKA